MVDIKEIELYEKTTGNIINREMVNKVHMKFREQGHTGFTAEYAFGHLTRLAKDPEKATKELNALLAEDTKDNGMQKVITDNINEVYNVFLEYNSSPEEILAVIELLRGNPLTPLMGTEDEWVLDEFLNDPKDPNVTHYSNKRCSRVSKHVFSNGLEIATCLESVIYSDNGGINFFTTGRFGRKQITFPFSLPEKPEVVYIYEPDEDKTPFILTYCIYVRTNTFYFILVFI